MRSYFPSYMFWSDWSDANPAIYRAWMDGRNKIKIVSSQAQVRWPNGLAIDDQHQRLYWTDAFLHKIAYCNFDGTGYHLLVTGVGDLPHPFAIAVYKVHNAFFTLSKTLTAWN